METSNQAVARKPVIVETEQSLTEQIDLHFNKQALSTRESSPVDFPVSSRLHGADMVTISVGLKDAEKQKFHVHRDLLCRASRYFQKCLKGSFFEANSDHLDVEECSMAFEVLYQWIYSGRILKATFYTNDALSEDVFWLRVFRLGDYRLVSHLQQYAYDKLRTMFNADMRVVPGTELVNELFDDDHPQELLERYLAGHTAFWINKGKGRYKDWEAVLLKKPRFGAYVAIELAKLCSKDSLGSKGHPSRDPRFADSHGIRQQRDLDELFTPGKESPTRQT